MQFTVPKFIEKKPKIVGPLTFQQLVFIGTAGAFCFSLYFIVPFFTFIIAATFLLGSASALAFIKIQGIPLPVVIKNLFIFILHPKIYLWKRKIGVIKILKREKELKEIEKPERKSPLKIAGHSALKELSSRIERKSK